jgi:hypothetical protein
MSSRSGRVSHASGGDRTTTAHYDLIIAGINLSIAATTAQCYETRVTNLGKNHRVVALAFQPTPSYPERERRRSAGVIPRPSWRVPISPPPTPQQPHQRRHRMRYRQYEQAERSDSHPHNR